MITLRNSTLLSIMLIFMLAGCAGVPIADGQVLSLQFPTTLNVIQQALAGAPGTHVLTDPSGSCYILTKTLQDGVGFIMLKPTAWGGGDVVGEFKGNYTTLNSMKAVEAALLERGWRYITPSELPTWVGQLAQASSDVLEVASYALTTIMIVPAGIFINPPEGAVTVDG